MEGAQATHGGGRRARWKQTQENPWHETTSPVQTRWNGPAIRMAQNGPSVSTSRSPVPSRTPIRTALLACQLSCHVRGTGEGGHSLVRRKGNGALGRGEKRSRRGGEIPAPTNEIVWWGKDRPRWRPSENTPGERNGWTEKDEPKPCHSVGPASPTGRDG
eukprot:scaffold281_cov318-Pavlova_lutheri.AAC.1